MSAPIFAESYTWLYVTFTIVLALVFVFVVRKIMQLGGAQGAYDSGPTDALGKFRLGLAKTRQSWTASLRSLLGRSISQGDLERLEEAMLVADMGVATTDALIGELRQANEEKGLKSWDQLLKHLKGHLIERLSCGHALRTAKEGPTVILVTGVNGVGKTTSIAKLAYMLKNRGKKVLLAAGDTFRAAAVEQLVTWSERLEVDIIKAQTGADPASVAYDATDAAVARGVDYLIVDTSGRLHTAENLMRELEKIFRVIKKRLPDAPHETLLVLDATTGQNAVNQAKEFKKVAAVTGIVLAKLDGTAKGGIVVAIREQVDIPVKFVGLGEKEHMLEAFDAEQFVEALFET